MTGSQMIDVAVRAVGWALLHSVWQGAAIAAVAGTLLWALRGATAQARYLTACLALAVVVCCWTVTLTRSAAQLSATTRAAAVRPPAPELGPGTFDLSAAIQPISPAALDDVPTDWRRRLDTWSVTLVPLWLIGVSVLSVRLAFGWLLIQRLRRSATAPVPAAVIARLAQLAQRVHVSRAVHVAHSAAVQVPAVVGWLRPIILLPVTALAGLTAEQLDAILAHELAHIRRHDFAVNVVQTAAEILLFYHPACWWISRRIRAEREHCCDDIAVSVCGDRLAYAAALADLETLRGEAGMALAVTDGPLVQRVRRIIAPSPRRAWTPAWAAVAVPVVVAALVLGSVTLTGTAQVGGGEQSRVPGAGRSLPGDMGIVEGQVLDAQSGRPIADAHLEVSGTDDAAFATTDGNGRFETRAMKPGTYLVSVNAKGYSHGYYGQAPGSGVFGGTKLDVRGGRITSGIDVRLQAAGRVSGRILDERGNGMPGVEIELVSNVPVPGAGRRPAAFAQTVADGSYRVSAAPGDYRVRAYVNMHTRALTPARGSTLAYASTFYPGVRAAEEAQLLRVDAGLELYDIDFTLAVTNLLRVSGTVIGPPDADLTSVRVMVRSIGADSISKESSAAVNAKGAFELTDLVPGAYMLTVWDKVNPSRWIGSMKHVQLEDDLADVEFRAEAGATVIGRVVRDARSARALDLSEVQVGFEKTMDGGGLTMAGFLGPKPNGDGSFTGNTPSGPLMMTLNQIPHGWAVKSIRLDNTEVFGQPVELSPGRHDVEVVLTDRVSRLSGIVVDRRGNPLAGYSVILFPEDVTKWHRASPLIVETRSHQNGQFQFDQVTPGDYLAVAVEGLPFRAWTNPNMLRQLQSLATRLKIGEGEQPTISIRASPTPAGIIDVP